MKDNKLIIGRQDSNSKATELKTALLPNTEIFKIIDSDDEELAKDFGSLLDSEN